MGGHCGASSSLLRHNPDQKSEMPRNCQDMGQIERNGISDQNNGLSTELDAPQ